MSRSRESGVGRGDCVRRMWRSRWSSPDGSHPIGGSMRAGRSLRGPALDTWLGGNRRGRGRRKLSPILGLLVAAPLVTATGHARTDARDIRFIATADPQYFYDDSLPGTHAIKARANDTLRAALERLADPDARGLVIGGDMTQFSRHQEFRWYREAIEDSGIPDIWRKVYDGAGNHDVELSALPCGRSAGLDTFDPGCEDRRKILEHLRRDRNDQVFQCRSPVFFPDDKKTYPCPHYSWEWGDVHFVQLNIFPAAGNQVHGEPPHEGPGPLNARSFLLQDLRDNVGTSGRPVVIIHHYNPITGEDSPPGPSTQVGWWREGEKIGYWNDIVNYNVVAIISGHSEPGPDDVWRAADQRTHLVQPALLSTEPGSLHKCDRLVGEGADESSVPCIPGVVAGSAKGREDKAQWFGDTYQRQTPGTFLDIRITGTTMTINRLKVDGHTTTTTGTQTIRFHDRYVPDPPTGKLYFQRPNQDPRSLTDGATVPADAEIVWEITGPARPHEWTYRLELQRDGDWETVRWGDSRFGHRCEGDGGATSNSSPTCDGADQPDNCRTPTPPSFPVDPVVTCTGRIEASSLPDGTYQLIVDRLDALQRRPDEGGAVATVRFTIDAVPTADAGGPYTADEGQEITLDGTASSDPAEEALSFAWDLDGDGAFDDAFEPTPTFAWGDDTSRTAGTVALQVTDPAGLTDVDETTVTVANVAPTLTAQVASPADEGARVTVGGTVTDPGWLDELAASIDWGDDSGRQPLIGTLETNPPDATLAWLASHAYGDNGTYTIQICAADDDGGNRCVTEDVVIHNVAPTVTIDAAQRSRINEGETVDVAASMMDWGWLDTYRAVIDWGTGDVSDTDLNVTADGPPFDVGNISGHHRYGDNGEFDVTVAVTDDDGGTGRDSFTVTVDNVAPTATIDRTGQITINSTDVFFTNAGQQLTLSGRSQDPGSDDLYVRWILGDGNETLSARLANPPLSDATPSPDIGPRDITDTTVHNYANACRYLLRLNVSDDDRGSTTDVAPVVVTGTSDSARGAGFWRHQYTSQGRNHLSDDTLDCYVDITLLLSRVFSEVRDGSDRDSAAAVLSARPKGNVRVQLDRQLLTAWLNFAHGAYQPNQPVDSDGDGVTETTFGEVMSAAENARLDPDASRDELESYKDLLERLNRSSAT